jgi:hypothetical protein
MIPEQCFDVGVDPAPLLQLPWEGFLQSVTLQLKPGWLRQELMCLRTDATLLTGSGRTVGT